MTDAGPTAKLISDSRLLGSWRSSPAGLRLHRPDLRGIFTSCLNMQHLDSAATSSQAMQALPDPCRHSPEQCSPSYPADWCPAAASCQTDMRHRSWAPRTPVAGAPPHLAECCRQRQTLRRGCGGARHWQRCCVPARSAEMHDIPSLRRGMLAWWSLQMAIFVWKPT